METVKIAVRGSTQEHLEIADISDDVVVLKDGSVVMLIAVSAVNFGLLSEREQEAIIFAYGGLLNSLNFPIQIVVRSQRKDVSHYVSLLEKEEKKQTNKLLAGLIAKYREYVTSVVKENNVLDKKFYIAIPFSSLELGIGTSAGGLIPKKVKTFPLAKETVIERAKVVLTPKKDHLLRQLARLGLRSKQLATTELIDLFYEIYNQPGSVSTEDMKMDDPTAKKESDQISKIEAIEVNKPQFESITTK